MRRWSVLVEDGRLSRLSDSLRSVVDEHRTDDVQSLLIAQAGKLLNEAEKTEVSVLSDRQMTKQIIAGFSGMVQQAFEWFEAETQNLNEFDFIKLSFVNLKPAAPDDGNSFGGKMSTNSRELPENFQVTPEIMLINLVTAITQFFTQVGRTTEPMGPEWSYSIDWVALTLNKSPDEI